MAGMSLGTEGDRVREMLDEVACGFPIGSGRWGEIVMRVDRLSALLVLVLLVPSTRAADPDRRFPLFARLTSESPPRLITYTPSQLDPRQEVNQRRLATSSIRAD